MTGGRRRPSRVLSAQSAKQCFGTPRAVYADCVRESTLEKNKFDILQPKALAYDIDPAGDYMRPGNSPAEQAFQLLRLRLRHVAGLADNAFPAFDKRTRKRGAQVDSAGVSVSTAVTADDCSAHAMPRLYAKVDGRLSGDEPPELTGDHHRMMYETVRSFYPLRRGGGKTWSNGWPSTGSSKNTCLREVAHRRTSAGKRVLRGAAARRESRRRS